MLDVGSAAATHCAVSCAREAAPCQACCRTEVGSRLPIPAEVPARHFLYKATTSSTACCQADLHALGADVERYLAVLGTGLRPSQIQVATPARISAILQSNFEHRLTAVLGRLGLGGMSGAPSVLFCEWAGPHVDESFEGTAFVSLVLRTGPEPYVLQTFDVSVSPVPGRRCPEVRTSSCGMSVGDVVVFDPTTPHMVMPQHPTDDQLLVLVQFEVSDATTEERQALAERFPPTPDIDTSLLWG